MKKLLLAFCLIILLLAMFLPLAAQDAPGSIPPIEEPTIEDAAQAFTNLVFLPLLLADGQPRNFPENTIVAAAAGEFDRDMIPVEMQVWWHPAYGHVHTAIKLPFAKEVNGVLTLPVRIVLHDNPGKLHRFLIGAESSVPGGILASVDMRDVTCAVSVCAWGFTVSIDTRRLQDGCRELRVKSYVNTPDGKQMITSSGIPILVNNGGTRSDFNKACDTRQLIGRGWYTGMDYTNAIIGNVPIAPVSGVYVFTARAQNPSAHLFVALDKSHYIPAVQGWDEAQDSPGTVLFDSDGNFQKAMPFSIDTTKLSNGWHNIQVKSTKPTGAVSSCSGCPAGVTSFPSGMAKVWFYVQN